MALQDVGLDVARVVVMKSSLTKLLVTLSHACFIVLKVFASEIGSYSHACEGEIICKLTNPKVFMGYFFITKFR